MQLKTLKQKQKLHSAFGAQLASFQKFTDEMVAKYGGSQPEPNMSVEESDRLPESNKTQWTQTQTAVATVLEFIDTMHDSLWAYHEADVKRAEGCSAAKLATSCEATFLDSNKSAEIEAWNTTANAHHANFLTCMEERSTACGNSNLLCDRYDAYRQQGQTKISLAGGWVRGDGTEPQYLDECVGEGHFGPTYIKATDVGVSLNANPAGMLATMEACLEKTNAWLNGERPPPTPPNTEGDPIQYDGLYPHYDQCDRDRDECDDLHKHCKDNQTHFEGAYCSYEQNWDSSCGAWERCYLAGETNCKKTGGDCDLIKDNVQGRKADNETGMRLTCLLQVLFGKWDGQNFAKRLEAKDRAAALEGCTNATYDTSDWDIDCDVGSRATAPDICTKGMCHGEPHTTLFQNAYYFSEGLQPAVVDFVGDPTYQHGIDKRIFTLGDHSCDALDGHENFVFFCPSHNSSHKSWASAGAQ